MNLRRLARRIGPWWRRFKRNGYRPDRCTHCGHRFAWTSDARHSYGNRDGKVYHGPCIAYLTWRRTADERLAVLDLVCEVWEVDARTAKGVVENRTENHDERVAASNRAFRVFNDLEKSRAL